MATHSSFFCLENPRDGGAWWAGWGVDLDYRNIEWFALEMNRDHSVIFEIAPK